MHDDGFDVRIDLHDPRAVPFDLRSRGGGEGDFPAGPGPPLQPAGQLIHVIDAGPVDVNVQLLPVARKSHVSEMQVHGPTRQDHHVLRGHSLRLVNRHGISGTDPSGSPVVQGDRIVMAIECNDQPPGSIPGDMPERPLQDLVVGQAGDGDHAIAFPELHDPFPGRELREAANLALRNPGGPDRIVEPVDVDIAMGERDRLSVHLPVVRRDRLRCRHRASMERDGALRGVMGESILGLAASKRDGGHAIALVVLPLDPVHLRGAIPVPQHPERHARSDGLELVGIANQDEFSAPRLHRPRERCHVPGAHHAGLVQDEHEGTPRRGPCQALLEPACHCPCPDVG